jgi:peptide methionine sulfoxide reductase msrA/msrB
MKILSEGNIMNKSKSILFALLLITTACSKTEPNETLEIKVMEPAAIIISGDEKIATVAGGCFWCIEAPFERVEGVKRVVSGYAGGTEPDPTYKQVSSGNTSYRETVQVYYNPLVISYEEILDIFWRQFDPTDESGSFADRGFQYTSAIFYHDEDQKMLAEKSKKHLNNSGKFDEPIATQIIKLTTFYPAEDYHQDFYKKDPDRYYSYRK